MQKPEYQLIILVVVVIIVLIIACFFIFILVAYTNGRKRKFREEKLEMENSFQQEILKTQLEIQEQTLRNISFEIHDNIGQVLSLAKLNLATTETTLASVDKINHTKTLIGKAIQDLRDLSKSTNPEYVIELGLVRSLEMECDNVRKTGAFDTELNITGKLRALLPQHELVVFRIVQELINNTIKHSGGKKIYIAIHYTADSFSLLYQDDGQGFSLDSLASDNKRGLGIKSMENRAKMIGATYSIDSKRGEGISVTIAMP